MKHEGINWSDTQRQLPPRASHFNAIPLSRAGLICIYMYEEGCAAVAPGRGFLYLYTYIHVGIFSPRRRRRAEELLYRG